MNAAGGSAAGLELWQDMNLSRRLQVLIPLELDARLRRAAQRRISKAEYVRRVLEESLRKSASDDGASDPLEQLSSLGAPTGDIRQILTETAPGRS